MDKKIGKSVVATGIAATTIISGSLTHQVKAEDLTKDDKKEPQTTEVTEKPVTEADLEVAKVQADTANIQVESQTETTEQAQKDVDKAKSVVEAAEKKVGDAEDLQKEATPEAIDQAQNDVTTAEEELASKEAELNQAKTEEAAADQAVKDQENTVAAQQSLVDMAEKDLNEAKAPLAREEQELAEAKAQEKNAEQELASKQAQLAQAQAVGNQAAAQTDLEQKVAQADAELKASNQAVAQKESQVAQLEASQPASQPVSFNGNYKAFLESAKNNGASQAIKDAAAKALETYASSGVNVDTGSKSAMTLENSLKALEIIKAINNYRRQAGLSELYVDPYANVQSQIQAILFEQTGWHVAKYFGNENVAISYTPQGAVDFWHSEKALYQQIAAQYGLPTDERQLDANAIYQKVGIGNFARIGHYVQMMDNKANAISAAYNNHANEYSSVNGTAEAGFHNVSNLAERLNNGTLMSVADFEALLRNGGAAAPNPALANLRNELANLKVQRTNQEVSLNILNHQLADLRTAIQNQAQNLATANQEVTAAQTALTSARQKVAAAQAVLNAATEKIAANLAPKELALKNAQSKLAEEQEKLSQLQAAQTAAQNKVQAATKAVEAAKARLQAAQERVAALQNAPQSLELAQAELMAAQENLAEKETILEEAELQLALYQAVFTKLDDKYNEIAAQLGDRAVLAATNVQASTLAQTETGQNSQTDDPIIYVNAASGGARAEQIALASNNTYRGQAVLNPQISRDILPATGSKASQLGLAGMALGILGMVLGKKRRREE